MLLFILKVIVFQILAVAIVIFILKKILDRQLIESAIKKVEIMNADLFDKNLSELVVVTSGSLKEAQQKRITNAISKKINKTIKLVIEKDRSIIGGLIIKLKEDPIDCSIKSRLKESGIVK